MARRVAWQLRQLFQAADFQSLRLCQKCGARVGVAKKNILTSSLRAPCPSIHKESPITNLRRQLDELRPISSKAVIT